MDKLHIILKPFIWLYERNGCQSCIKFLQRKKASMKAKKISNPKPLEVFIAVTEYKKQEKGEISLQVGAVVEVVEKTETGWWFVNVEEEQGWVPSTCLEREDGTREDSTVVLKPGEEEQYLCTEEFKGQSADEISLDRGAVVDVLEKNLEGWWRVRYNGREGFAPATFLMKCESVKIKKQGPEKPKPPTKIKAPVQKTVSTGPQIVKSLHEVSDLLNEENGAAGNNVSSTGGNQTDDDFDDNYELPDEDKIYSINELSKILKEDKRGNEETDKIYESIHAMKSRSLKRHGSTRPPPRPSMKPKTKGKSPLAEKAVFKRLESQNKEYVTICDFSNAVGDGISFKAGQHVKVLEKNESGWWYIEFDDKEGWAPASYIETYNQGQTTSNLTAEDSNQRPKSPIPTSPLPKSPLSKSREELSDVSDDRPSSPKRQSAAQSVGDLASALKSRLKPKGQGLPKPPKKDFLDEEPSVNDGDKLESSQNSSRFSNNAVVKPSINTKPVDRSRLSAPPPPPSASKVSAKPSIAETVSKNRPVTPTKPKNTVPSSDNNKRFTSSIENANKSNEEEAPPGKLNVSGLAGALKARFEGQENDKTKPEPPAITQKPKPDNSTKPFLKPVPKKSVDPLPSNKPKDALKPLPFNKPNPVLKPAAPSNKPSWVKSDNNTSTSEKPSWAKNENETKSKDKLADENSTPKVSDLASVLKAKFENRTSNVGEPNVEQSPPTKPKTVTKPSVPHGRPQTPPGSNARPPGLKPPNKPEKPPVGRSSSPMNTDRKVDINKYSSRPLPPKPAGENKSKDSNNIHDTKPFPSLPVKPKPPVKNKTADTKSDSDSDEAKPIGVSGLANALNAKFGGKVNDLSGVNSRPTPVKPTVPKVNNKKSTIITDNDKNKSTNVSTDKENNNTETSQKSDTTYRAVANHTASNDGEITISIGQEVELIEKADGWWYVCTDSAEGWAPSSYLEKVKPKGAGDQKSTSGPKILKPKRSVFRTCSDFEAEHEGELSVPRGQEVNVIDKDDGGWWFVNVEGKEGWVPAAYLEEL